MRRAKKPKPYYSRKRKQWRARLRVGETTFEQWFKTKQESIAQIDEWWLSKAAGVSAEGMTLKEFSSRWLASIDVRDSSRRRYAFDLVHVGPIERLPLDRIRRKVVVDLLDEISSSATRQRVRTVLNQIFLAAVEQEYVRTNIIRDIKPVKHVKKPVEIYTEDELRAVREKLRGHRSRVMIELMLETGTRPGETWVLQWGDLRRGNLHIERTLAQNEHGAWIVSDSPKTEAGRRAIPLSDKMLEMLLAERATAMTKGRAGKTDLIFTNSIGTMIKHNFKVTVLAPLLRNAGVAYRKPHTFRHTAASAMLNGGVPVTIVAAILGHEDASVTLRVYAHLIGSETEKAKRFWDDQNAAKG